MLAKGETLEIILLLDFFYLYLEIILLLDLFWQNILGLKHLHIY